MPGISMSRSATSGKVAQSRGDDLVASANRRHDAEVLLQVKQRRERGANELLVVREEKPDRHAGAPAASRTASRHPLGDVGPASMVPPAKATRSASPVSPLPQPPAVPTPSSLISTEEGEMRTVQELRVRVTDDVA